MRLVSEIVVSDRHRADLGDVTALCESIERLGLLHPIVIRPDGRLVAGARRLAAVKQLGWESAPAEFGRHDLYADPASPGPVFDRRELFAVGVEGIGASLAVAHMTHPYHRRPGTHRNSLNDPHSTTNALEAVVPRECP